jgi:ribosomal protein S30
LLKEIKFKLKILGVQSPNHASGMFERRTGKRRKQTPQVQGKVKFSVTKRAFFVNKNIIFVYFSENHQSFSNGLYPPVWEQERPSNQMIQWLIIINFEQ